MTHRSTAPPPSTTTLRPVRRSVSFLLATVLAVGGSMLLSPRSQAVGLGGTLKDEGEFQLNKPWGITTDEFGNIYVVDSRNNRVVKFNRNNEPLFAFGEFGYEDGQLQNPEGIVYGNGLVYVADTSNHRVQVFDANGVFQRSIGAPGSGEGELAYPTGMAYAFGEIFVSEGGAACRVSRFTTGGRLTTRFGGCGTSEGSLACPGGVAVAGGEVFVSDQCRGVVQKYASTGGWEATIGSQGAGPGELGGPDGIVATQDINARWIWVVDSGYSHVSQFKNTGEFVSRFRTPDFAYPHGLAMNQQGTRLYVANTGGEPDVYWFTFQEPRIHVGRSANLGYLARTEGIWLDMYYNQVGGTCRVLARATVSVPGHARFTVEDDFTVGNSGEEYKIDVSSRQARWMKGAKAQGKEIPIEVTVNGRCSEDVRVRKTINYRAR